MKSKIAFVATLVLAVAFPIVALAASFGTQNFFYAPGNVITPLPGFSTSWAGSGITPIASGGTATSTGGVTNGIEYFNGSYLTNGSKLTTDGNGDIILGGSGTCSVSAVWCLLASSTLSNAFVLQNPASSLPALTVTTNGYFGFSTTTPTSLITIDGSSTPSVTPFIVQNGASSTPSFIVSSANNNGRVGIATSTPMAPFSITNGGSSYMTMNGGTFNIVSANGATTIQTITGTNGAALLQLLENSTSLLKVLSTGVQIADGTVPTAATSTGSGTGSVPVTIGGGANDFTLTITTGSSPSTNATIATFTLATACSNATIPAFSAGNSNAATVATSTYATSASSQTFTLKSGATALLAATQYIWNFHAGCY